MCVNRKTGKIISPIIGENGRTYLSLTHKKKRYKKQLSRWIALAFIPLPYGDDPNIFHSDHIDGDITNNNLYNIQWLTPEENLYKELYVENKIFKGEKNKSSILTEKIVRNILDDILSGMDDGEISKKYNIKRSHANNIRLGKIWKHISDEYDLSKFNKLKRTTVRYDDNLKQEIINLLKTTNLSYGKIANELNIENNNKILCLIYNINKKYECRRFND